MNSRSMHQFAASLTSRIRSRIRTSALGALAILAIGFATAQTARAQVDYSTVLYSFAGAPGDGQFPHNGALVRGASGNLFGTTQSGGAKGAGTVFELVNSSGTYTEKLLYSFTYAPDGAGPDAGVIMDSSGNLYGTTENGGVFGGGAVFELVNSAGTYTEKLLLSFQDGANTNTPGGAKPFAGVIMDSSGNLYGITQLGGTYAAGVAFELVNSSGTYTEKVLSSISTPDPLAGLIMDSSGNLFGATGGFGNVANVGTVFELVNSSGTYTQKLLYSFPYSPGGGPAASLIMDSSGNLYGTTQGGGTNATGSVFELINSFGTYTEKTLYSFANNPDGAGPAGSLLMDSSGNLYGTTVGGGSSYGIVFELVNSSGTFSEKVLHTFGSSGATDGRYPYSALIMDSAGNLFGTTAGGGGSSNYGTAFEIYTFNGTNLATTTTVTSSANPAVAGSGLYFTATVTSSAPFSPTGAVAFFDGDTQLGASTLNSGSASLAATTSESLMPPAGSLVVGTHIITAQYTPDNPTLFQASSGSLTQIVNESSTEIDGNNTYNGNQMIDGNVSASGTFSGNGSGLTNVTASNLNCAYCVGNNQLGINYAGSLTQGGPANNALLLNGLMASAFQPVGSYATTGANSFVGDQTVGGNLTVTGGTVSGGAADFSGQVTTGPIVIGGGTAITQYVSVTLNVTLPALSANTCTTFSTAALTGFTPGTTDTIAFGIPSSLQSSLTAGVYLIWQAWETTTTLSPTITVQACNGSATSLNAGNSGVIRLDVFKH